MRSRSAASRKPSLFQVGSVTIALAAEMRSVAASSSIPKLTPELIPKSSAQRIGGMSRLDMCTVIAPDRHDAVVGLVRRLDADLVRNDEERAPFDLLEYTAEIFAYDPQ